MRRIFWLAVVLTLVATPLAAAEDPPAEEPAPKQDVADEDKYTAEELKELVGPIALYPDIVLSSMLPASTAPVDVVQAARWVKEQDGEIEEAPDPDEVGGSVALACLVGGELQLGALGVD